MLTILSRYPDDLLWATGTADIEAARASGKIASLIGVESGHAIGSSLPILRTLYDMGARSLFSFQYIVHINTFPFRYMTLTHGCNTPWADAAQVEQGSFPPRSNGISQFGEKVSLRNGLKSLLG